ncbi:hypothetical protein CG4_08320 [Helicobacter pylori]
MSNAELLLKTAVLNTRAKIWTFRYFGYKYKALFTPCRIFNYLNYTMIIPYFIKKQ